MSESYTGRINRKLQRKQKVIRAAAGKCKADLVLAGITPTEERSKEVAFSNIYYDSHMVAVVKKTDADKYTTYRS